MSTNTSVRWMSLLAAIYAFGFSSDATAQYVSKPRILTALENIMNLDRPGQDGFATIWDGNKYVQCGRMFDRSLRCEAAGTLMQPSLGNVLTPERVGRLAALGWRLDSRFGNYVRDFPPAPR